VLPKRMKNYNHLIKVIICFLHNSEHLLHLKFAGNSYTLTKNREVVWKNPIVTFHVCHLLSWDFLTLNGYEHII